MSEQPIFQRIRSFIDRREDLCLYQVADKSGIPRGRFYNIMSGVVTLHADELEAICKGLEVEPNLFVGTNS